MLAWSRPHPLFTLVYEALTTPHDSALFFLDYVQGRTVMFSVFVIYSVEKDCHGLTHNTEGHPIRICKANEGECGRSMIREGRSKNLPENKVTDRAARVSSAEVFSSSHEWHLHHHSQERPRSDHVERHADEDFVHHGRQEENHKRGRHL
jgi:hypothetical protein